MTILIDLTSLADNFSGMERFCSSIALELLKYKSNKYILVFKETLHFLFEKHKNDENIKIILLKKHSKIIFNQIILPLTLMREKADIYLFLAFPQPLIFINKNSISTIYDMVCYDCPETMKNTLVKWYFRFSYKIACKRCKKIITISNFSKNRILQNLKISPDKIWIINCGVDKKFLNYKNKGEDEKTILNKYKIEADYILALSTLEPRKNLNVLITIYSKLVKTFNLKTPLVLAGRRGWKTDTLLSDIDDDVKKQILFTGFIEDEDLPTIYGNALLFIFPSSYEGFGIPPVEALACGTPVLASRNGSLPEVLGEAAFYFDTENDLFTRLKNMLIDGNLSYDKNFGKKQAYKYKWNEQAKKLMTFLQNM